jgi:hypothetical protein
MRVNSVLDVFGALILLALATVLIRNPKIVETTFTGFNKALSTARG